MREEPLVDGVPPAEPPDDIADQVEHAQAVEAAGGPPVNRRKHTRYRFRSLAPVVWFMGEPLLHTVELETSYIAVNGVRFVGRAALRPGVRGVMRLRKSDGSLALIGIEVKRCTYVGRMRSASGCEFVRMPEAHAGAWFADQSGGMATLRAGVEIVPHASAQPDEMVDPYAPVRRGA